MGRSAVGSDFAGARAIRRATFRSFTVRRRAQPIPAVCGLADLLSLSAGAGEVTIAVLGPFTDALGRRQTLVANRKTNSGVALPVAFEPGTLIVGPIAA